MKGDPIAMALDAIKGDARKAKVARALPEGQRPKGFMISIGMIPEESEAEEGMEHASVPAVQVEDDEDEES